jgi:hypothetical protein
MKDGVDGRWSNGWAWLAGGLGSGSDILLHVDRVEAFGGRLFGFGIDNGYASTMIGYHCSTTTL